MAEPIDFTFLLQNAHTKRDKAMLALLFGYAALGVINCEDVEHRSNVLVALKKSVEILDASKDKNPVLTKCACKTPDNSGIHTLTYCGPRFTIQHGKNIDGFRVSDMLTDSRVATCYDFDNARMVRDALNQFHSESIYSGVIYASPIFKIVK